MTQRVALVSYSTRPRGGVVHTLALAEELHRQGVAVEVLALGDPQTAFFRRVDAPFPLIPTPPPQMRRSASWTVAVTLAWSSGKRSQVQAVSNVSTMRPSRTRPSRV